MKLCSGTGLLRSFSSAWQRLKASLWCLQGISLKQEFDLPLLCLGSLDPKTFPRTVFSPAQSHEGHIQLGSFHSCPKVHTGLSGFLLPSVQCLTALFSVIGLSGILILASASLHVLAPTSLQEERFPFSREVRSRTVSYKGTASEPVRPGLKLLTGYITQAFGASVSSSENWVQLVN